MSVDVVTESGELVPVAMPQLQRMTPDQAKAQANWLRDMMRSVLTESTDYGTIPGTSKPTLYKAGAEMLLIAAGLTFTQTRLDDDDLRLKEGVTYRCTVKRSGEAVAECDGYAGFDERGFRRGLTPWNTLVKMAQKRALVGAALNAVAGSGLFIADLDDDRERQPASDADGELPRNTQAANRRRATQPTKPPLPLDEIAARIEALPLDQRNAHRKFVAERKLPWPTSSRAVVVQIERELVRLEAEARDEADTYGDGPVPDGASTTASPTDTGDESVSDASIEQQSEASSSGDD